MASPLDDVEQYQQEPDAPPSQLDDAEQRLTSALPNTNRYAHRQIVDQLRGIRVEREIEGRKARAQATATRLKARDLADRGIPTFREANGVAPVTDEAGAPLTNYDKPHGIAYDSAGNARSVDYGPTGPPNLNDPFANSRVETDPKTGDQYQKRAGLPWKWVGADEGIKSQRMQEEKDKAVKQEAALLGQKISIQHADLVAGDKEHELMHKELVNEVPTLQDPTLAGADREAILGAIDNHFNSEYARPEANATNGWFSKELAPSAQKLRGEIDARKEGAMQKANRLFDLKDQQNALGDEIAANHDQRQNEIDTLIAHGRGQQGPLDAQGMVNPAGDPQQIHTPNGNPYPITKDGYIDTNVPGGSMEDALQKLSPGPGWSYNGSSGQWSPPQPQSVTADHQPISATQSDIITGHPATDAAIADAKAGIKPYRIDDKDTVQFPREKMVDSLDAAVKDGVIDQKWADDHRAEFQNVQDKYNELQKAAGSAQVLKALLHGGGVGAAFLAGSGPGAAAGAAAGAALTAPIAEGGGIGPGIGAVLGGLTTGTIAAFAARKGMEKLGEYSDAVKSLNASAELHPLADASGELVAFASSAPRALSKLYKLGTVAAESVADLGPQAARAAAVKVVGKQLGYGALTGAAFEGVVRPAFDAARYTAADALGIPHDQFQTPTAQSILTQSALGALLAGHSIEFKDYSARDVASVLFRARARNEAGIPLDTPDEGGNVVNAFARAGINMDNQQATAAAQPLSPQEIHLYNALKEKTARMEKSGLFDGATGVKFKGGTQARVPTMGGEGAPIVSAGVEPTFKEGPQGPAEPARVGGPPPAPPTPPTEGEPNVPEAPSTSQPARPEGSKSEPIVPNATGATGGTRALTEGSNEPAAGATSEAPATAGGSKESAKPGAVSPAVDQAAHEAATSPTNAKPEPTSGQQKAGNYEKGHIVQLGGAGGINVAIENPQGSQRSNLDTNKLGDLARRVASETQLGDVLGPAATEARHGNYQAALAITKQISSQLKVAGHYDLADSVHAIATKAYAQPMESHYGYVKGTVGADKDHIDVFIKPGTPTNYSGPVYVVDQTTTAGKETFDEHKAIVGASSHEEALAEYRKNYDAKHQNNYSGVTEFKNIQEFKKWAESGVKGPAAKSKGVTSAPPSRPVTGVAPAGDVKSAETQLWRLTSKDSPQLLNSLRKQYGDHPDYLDVLNEHIQKHAGKAEAISGEHGVGDKITIDNQNWKVTGVEGGNTKLQRAGNYHQGGQVATQTLNTNFVRNQIASGHFTLEPASKVGQVPAREETAPSESAGPAGQEVAGKPQRQQSDVRNRPRISTPEAARTAVEAATREHAADLKKSGTQVTSGPTKTESGFQTNADGDVTVDHAKLVPHAEHIWERGGHPADWIKDAIGEEGFHSRQVKVAGNNFTKIYSAIHKQLPAEARAVLERVYPDDKTPASQAAEYVRMLWQHRTGKKITEAHFRNISGLLPHLIGKQPTLVEQELKRVMDYSAPASDTGSKPVAPQFTADAKANTVELKVPDFSPTDADYPESKSYLADKGVAGKIYLEHPKDFETENRPPRDFMVVEDSTIAKSLQHQGYGTQLYNEALKLAQEKGYKGIASHFSDRNEASDAFWNKISQGKKNGYDIRENPLPTVSGREAVDTGAPPVSVPKLQPHRWSPEDQAHYKQQKAALTKAENAKDYPKIIELADAFEKYYDDRGMSVPDDWARWARAKEDAQIQVIRQKGYEKPVTESREELVDRIDQALERMRGKGLTEDNNEHYQALKAKRDAIAEGKPYSVRDVTREAIAAIGAKIGDLTKATGLRSEPPPMSLKQRKAKAAELSAAIEKSISQISAKDQQVLMTLLRPDAPTITQLDQAARMLARLTKGGENAVTTGKEPEGGKQEHIGVPSGEHVPADEGKVREKEGGQASGSGGAGQQATAPEPPGSSSELPTLTEAGRLDAFKRTGMPEKEAIRLSKVSERYLMADQKAVLENYRKRMAAGEIPKADFDVIAVSEDVKARRAKVEVPDDVAQALRDLAEGLGAAAPKPAASLKMAAIYHALTVKGHSVEKVAKDFAMPPKIVEQIYDKMAGVRLGAAAPKGITPAEANRPGAAPEIVLGAAAPWRGVSGSITEQKVRDMLAPYIRDNPGVFEEYSPSTGYAMDAIPSGIATSSSDGSIGYNPKGLAEYANYNATYGGDALKHIELGIDEELTHSRDVRATQGNYEKVHEKLWSEVPANVRSVVKEIHDHGTMAELLRMKDQLRRLGTITETTMADWHEGKQGFAEKKDRSGALAAIKEWQPSKAIEDHLARMAVPAKVTGPQIAQKQLPKEKRAAALAAADKLVAAGFNTPEKFAGALAAVPALHPYAQSIWDVMAATGDVPRGTHDFNALLAPKESKTATVADLHPITAHVRDQLVAGKAVPRAALTALADQHGVSTKEADELAEAGVVRAARYIIENVPSYQKPEAIFDRMVELHEDQPNLSAKTATSKIAQAYSTPIPVAYVASRLADIAGGKIIYEPTAGNGALLIEANPSSQEVHANELNDNRAAQLKSQGFKVTSNDATEWRPQIKADRMVENPLFGAVKDDNGESKKFDVQGLETTQIDHAITLASLEALADDGRAVLIVGGPGTGTGDVIPDDAKREKYYYEGQRGDFWKKLYENNRVIDHFTIEGDLYEKQGAGWPIDMVVIAGVGQSPIRLPSANAPRIISSWEELRNELSRTDKERIAAGKLSAGEAADEVSGAISGIRDITGSGAGPDRPRPGSSVTSRPGFGGSSVSPAVSPAEQSEPTPAGGTETGVRPATGPAGGAVTGKSGSEHEQRGQLGVEGEGYPEPDVAQYRVPYKPKSKHPTFHIFTPTNLEHPQSEALRKVAEKVGDIDEYVRTQLGYSDKEGKKFKEEYYSAEQIDTLALAIHAAENNSAFITGDQGGVGKGRIAAGMMLYAMQKGWIPIFMTRDEKLYAAMLEDLDDVGRGNLVPMFTNNGMRFEDHRKQVWRTGNQSAVMNQIRDSGKLPDGIDLLFTSYYQVQNDVPRGWNPGKGARAGLKARKQAPPDGPRMEALRRIAPNSLFIMDESHEASGDSIRAWRLEPLLTSSPAAYYSSATFAKRPDSVGIYFRTTLSHAAPTMQELIDALSTGGVPLQQASISMLADDGLYMRRERDFGESTFNTHISLENADRDKGLADSYTAGLRKILGLSNQIAQIAELINKLIKSQGKRMGAASSPRLESTNFAAVIHNLVSQYLLSIKTHATVERAIEHIKEGRRVVVTVQNTMESAIRSLRAGGLPLSFNGLLQRLLEQQRTLRTGGRNPEEFYISDEPNPEFEQYEDRQLETMLVRYETDEEGQRVGVVNGDAVTEYFRRKSIALINETREFIEGIDLGDMPLSPIDYMRHAMEDAGYKTAEITGRGVGLNRANEIYDIKGFERSKKAQLGYMRDFNDGDVQFLVMNASGSTGISLHASKKFKNQDQRAMLVVQPHLDINQFMQSLWRIDRTGQVKPPFFEVIQTAIPAELRPAAVRERKMASLNANTTSNAKNEMRAQDMDIFNEFGDEVVYGYLASDPGFVTLLQWDAITDKNGNLVPFDSIEMEPGKFVAGVTGRLAILPTAEGEEFWTRVNEEYRALIQHLDDTGQNTLKVAAIDMRAETLSSREFTAGNPTGDSAFDGPSHMEQVKAQVGKAPRMGTEVLEKANEVQREAPEVMRKWEATADDWYRTELNRRLSNEVSYLTDAEKAEAQQQFGATDPALNEREWALRNKMSGWVTRMNNAREEISNSLRLLGDTVHIHSERGLDVYGAVIEAKLDDEHPLTPSKQEFNVWVNSTMRQIRFSAAQLSKDATTTPRDHFVEAYENTAERSNERYIVTGNLLAASVSLANQVQGQRIIVYTDDKGLMKQGILLPANFNPHTFVGREEVQGADHFQQLLDDGRTVTNRNQAIMIMKKAAGTYELRVPASRTGGGKYWENHTLRSHMNNSDFVQRGSQMVGTFGNYYLKQVFQTLTNADRLATQLFFNRPVTDGPATQLGAAAPRFARDYWTEDVKPTLANAKATMREVVDAAIHVLSPTHGVNKDVVDQVHKLLGERNQVAFVVDRTGEAFEQMFQSMPRPDQITFIDRVKTGQPQPTPELEQAARFIRGVDTEAWQAMHDASTAAGFKESPVKWLENHYRVMWKKIPDSVDRGGAPGQGKRPLRGSRGMAKQHTLDDMSEGIDRGGVPFTYNPITNLKMALADIWKYTTALKMWSWAKEHGFVSFVRGPFPKLPEGMVWLDDSIADVWFPAESGEGLIHAGKYAVEEGFGRLLNNFLSRDLVRQAKTGRGLMWLKNATTSLELSLSLFHGVFETGEAIASNIGLGLSKLYNRGVLQGDTSALMSGLIDLMKSPASPVTVATLGAAFRKAAGRPDAFWQTPEGKAFLQINPDARDLINHLFTGGWKPTEVEADWKNKSVRVFMDAISELKSGSSSNYIGAALRAFPAANEFLMGPLFDIYIPNLKIGQFVMEMRESLRQNDLKYGAHGYYIDRQGRRHDRPTNAELARKVWRLVEDRFGELNYDTLFWNNTFKSAMQLMFRSVTWKLGSVEAFYGAFKGQGKEFVDAFKERRAPELHRNMAWLFGIFLATAVLGTIIQTVFAKKKPQSLTDLVFPRIDPNDDKVRVSVPTYFKDLVHLVHSPPGYVKASLAGWIGRVADLMANKDYYGVQIRDTDDPATKQALAVGKYAGQSVLPFSIRGYKNLSSQQENTLRKSMALLGINPAPRYIGQTPAEKQVEKFWHGQRTEEGTKPEQYEIQKGKRELVSKIRHGQSPDIPGALARGTIKPADIKGIYKRATMGQLASSIDRMPLAEAEKVYAKADATERAQLSSILAKKRSNSLRRSGRSMYTGF